MVECCSDDGTDDLEGKPSKTKGIPPPLFIYIDFLLRRCGGAVIFEDVSMYWIMNN